MSSLRVAALTLTVTTGLVAAGCGGSASSLSPTGPSLSGGISGAALASDAGTFGTEKKGGEPGGNSGPGNGHGDGKEDGHGPGQETGRPEHPGQGRPDGRGVEVNGRITAIDAVAHTFQVGTATVSVPETVTIRHGNRTFLLADLAVGDHVEVKGLTNDAGVLVASEVKVEKGGKGDDDDEDDDDEAASTELSGAVAGLTGTCPALTFNILTTKVTTTATTTFSGVTCAALANGAVVEVKGTTQADGSVVATRVSTEAKATGAVSALTGTCPALTFNILTTKVTTSATTTFFGVTCAGIANGTLLEVEGTLQADGSIAAAHVSIED